jgi:molybdate transport system substrate-binding protein
VKSMLMRIMGLLVLGLMTSLTHTEEITVAVASNFTAPMKAIVAGFEKSSGHKVKLSFGSSGKFYAQIKNGAPFQVFFSADQAKPKALEQDGLAVPESRVTYAIGILALWSAKPGSIDGDATILKQGNFNKLALANPKLAPYGTAAVDVLENLKLKKVTQAKWVQGENIAQTYQFVRTGNADIGFVALSQIIDKDRVQRGSAWVVPNHLHRPILQDAVLLRSGESSQAAQQLLRFAQGKKAREIIESHGYKIPRKTAMGLNPYQMR